MEECAAGEFGSDSREDARMSDYDVGPKLLESTTRTLARYSDYHGSNVHKSKMNSYQEGNCFTAWEGFLIC